MLGEEEIHSVPDYLKVIKKYKEISIGHGNAEDFVFRGQAGDLPLIPKIGRLQPKGELLETEKLLLEEFKRTNPLLISELNPADDWDYLTLGQHFGLPTRFLDWSNNALTALWFATDAALATESSFSYAVVWVLVAERSDYQVEVTITHPFEVKETKIFRPRIIKQRINNQSGVFSIQPSGEIKHKSELDKTDSFSKKLLKIRIPVENFKEIRSDLHYSGNKCLQHFPRTGGAVLLFTMAIF